MEIKNELKKNVSQKIAKSVMRLIGVLRRNSSGINYQIDISRFGTRRVIITTVWHDIIKDKNLLLGVEVRTRSNKGIDDKIIYSKINGKEEIEILKA